MGVSMNMSMSVCVYQSPPSQVSVSSVNQQLAQLSTVVVVLSGLREQGVVHGGGESLTHTHTL